MSYDTGHGDFCFGRQLDLQYWLSLQEAQSFTDDEVAENTFAVQELGSFQR